MPEQRMLALKELLLSGLHNYEKNVFEKTATNAKPQAP